MTATTSRWVAMIARHPALVLGDLELRALALGDVAREAERPDDGAVLVAKRQLRRRDPGVGAVLVRLLLLEVDERLARADDLLLVLERLLRVLGAEEIGVGVADRRVGVLELEPRA